MTKAEMVRLAAERVMGWRMDVDFEVRLGHLLTISDTTRRPWSAIFDPTERDADALMLLDKLAGQGYAYTIQLLIDPVDQARSVCVSLRAFGKLRTETAIAPTRPFAILKAALRAVGVEVPDA